MVNPGFLLKILDEETSTFAFFPVINATYLLILNDDGLLFAGTIAIALLSSLVYLTMENDSPSSTLQNLARIVYPLWFIGFAATIWHLWQLFSENYYFPEILVIGSATFLSLIISDLILGALDTDYDNTM